MEVTRMKMNLKTVAIAAASLASATLFSPNWTEQGGWSLTTSQAEAQARVYITRGYAASSGYFAAEGFPWYAVRAYYFGGPWSGPGFSYTGWSDYAARNGIGCTPGTAIKGGDGIMYLCQ
jgi:hypothetical protein